MRGQLISACERADDVGPERPRCVAPLSHAGSPWQRPELALGEMQGGAEPDSLFPADRVAALALRGEVAGEIDAAVRDPGFVVDESEELAFALPARRLHAERVAASIGGGFEEEDELDTPVLADDS